MSSQSSTNQPIAQGGAGREEPAAGLKGLADNQTTSVESVINSIGGALATAPAAALEAVQNALPSRQTVDSTTSSASSSLPSLQQVQDQASKTAASANATAQSVVAQATNLAQQAISQLPTSVTSVLPASLTSPTSVPTHQSAAPVTSESRETTSAPIAESRNDRPEGVLKPLIPDTSSGTSAGQTPLGKDGGDAFTQPHTIGNFAASGMLQATHNPEIVDAQSDLAIKAESGDL